MTETLGDLRHQFQRERQRIIELYGKVTSLRYDFHSVTDPEHYYLKNLGEKP